MIDDNSPKYRILVVQNAVEENGITSLNWLSNSLIAQIKKLNWIQNEKNNQII